MLLPVRSIQCRLYLNYIVTTHKPELNSEHALKNNNMQVQYDVIISETLSKLCVQIKL